MVVLTAAAICVILVSYIRYKAGGINGHVESFMIGFQVGLFSAGVLIAIFNIYSCIKALKSEVECKKLYIKENDERDKAIKSRITCIAFQSTIGVLLVAGIVMGFYDMTVFVTLLSVLMFMCVMMVVLKVIFYKFMQ